MIFQTPRKRLSYDSAILFLTWRPHPPLWPPQRPTSLAHLASSSRCSTAVGALVADIYEWYDPRKWSDRMRAISFATVGKRDRVSASRRVQVCAMRMHCCTSLRIHVRTLTSLFLQCGGLRASNGGACKLHQSRPKLRSMPPRYLRIFHQLVTLSTAHPSVQGPAAQGFYGSAGPVVVRRRLTRDDTRIARRRMSAFGSIESSLRCVFVALELFLRSATPDSDLFSLAVLVLLCECQHHQLLLFSSSYHNSSNREPAEVAEGHTRWCSRNHLQQLIQSFKAWALCSPV